MTHPPIDQQVTFLQTRDLPTTIHFYENVLGLSLVLDQGKCRIYRISDTGFLGFCHSDNVPEQPKGIIFTIVTRQVDAWYRYLSQQGIAFEKPPARNPTYNIYHCVVRDPNGYLLEIQQFLDPAWAEPGKVSEKTS